jgi:ribosomal protein S18 acetylase RimI-like enzyme
VSPLPPGYELLAGTPRLDEYLDLRLRSGLTPKTEAQARAALSGSWSSCHIVHDGHAVAMGRVIGDGGWYFHVVDMATLPEHQRRGLGSAVLARLLDEIRRRAPQGAYVSLIADVPGRPLYERHGFTETAPQAVAMALVQD